MGVEVGFRDGSLGVIFAGIVASLLAPPYLNVPLTSALTPLALVEVESGEEDTIVAEEAQRRGLTMTSKMRTAAKE